MSGRFFDAVTLGPQRRRRRMTRQLAQLDRADRFDQLFVRGQSSPPPKQGRTKTTALSLAILVAIGGVVWLAGPWRNHKTTRQTLTFSSGGSAGDAGAAPAQQTSQNAPPAGVEEQKTRLLPKPVGPVGTGGYAFLAKEGNGQPVRYDPCRPIHFVIRDKATPAGGDIAIRNAVAAVSKATGLKFVDDGMTQETPTNNRKPYQPAVYGKRWAPVLIAWTDPTEYPRLAGSRFGFGGSMSTGTSNADQTYVSGIVYLDAPELASLDQKKYQFTFETVVEHELGHLVGLDHVQDKAQLMYPDSRGQSGYGPGDLRGLAIEGSGSCHPEL